MFFLDSKRDCLEQFGKEANAGLTRDDDVLCTTDYSRIVPLENGEVRRFKRLGGMNMNTSIFT